MKQEDMQEDEDLEEGELSDEELQSAQTLKDASSEPPPVEKKLSTSGNDFEAFLKKKRVELQQKVKDQLQQAGYKANVEPAVEPGEPAKVETSPTPARLVEPVGSSSLESAALNEGAPPRPSRLSKARYKDFDSRPLPPTDPTETMISSWLRGKNKAKTSTRDGSSTTDPGDGYDPNDEYYYGQRMSPSIGAEDKDYRFGRADDGRNSPFVGGEQREFKAGLFGDRDYRLSDRNDRMFAAGFGILARRRRRHSGSEDENYMDEEYGGRGYRRGEGFRKRRRGPPSPTSPPRRRPYRWDHRPSICKFFREGYCRDGDTCPFSHDAEDSRRKSELCKFYQQGYCKKNFYCPFLHGEYPCKAFHKGECSKGDDCMFSHFALNDYTRPIFDKLVKDEELAAKIHIPPVPLKRKTLLPPPLPGAAPTPAPLPRPPPADMPPATYEMPFQPRMPFMPNGSDNAVPTVGAEDEMKLDVTGGFERYTPPENYGDEEETPRTPQPSVASPLLSQESQGDENPGFNIDEMLRKIKAQVGKATADDEQEESPASPPPQAPSVVEAQTPQAIPFHGVPQYCLIAVDVEKQPLNEELVQASLTDTKLRNDPRIKRLLDNQFNAVSTIIQKTTSVENAATALSKQNVQQSAGPIPQDPRTGASTRDPRLQRQSQATITDTNSSPQQQVVPPPPMQQQASANDLHMQEMVKMQLNLMHQQQQTGVLPPAGVTMMAMQPPPMAPIPPPGPPPLDMNFMMLTGSSAVPPTQVHTFTNPMRMATAPGHLGVPGMSVAPPPGWMPHYSFSSAPELKPSVPPPMFNSPSGGTNSEALDLPTQPKEKLVLTRQRKAQSRWNKEFPLQKSSPPQNSAFSTEHAVEDNENPKVLSMREKRKDLQYDSPLASGAQSRSANSDPRYNEIPNVKVRKVKTSPLAE